MTLEELAAGWHKKNEEDNAAGFDEGFAAGFGEAASELDDYVKAHRGEVIGEQAPTATVVPVDPDLFARTAPRWNCVSFPGDGMHYLNRDGSCQWCGATREDIAAEWRQRDENERPGNA